MRCSSWRLLVGVVAHRASWPLKHSSVLLPTPRFSLIDLHAHALACTLSCSMQLKFHQREDAILLWSWKLLAQTCLIPLERKKTSFPTSTLPCVCKAHNTLHCQC